MFCISINHKNTPADVRERFAFTTKGQRQFTERLKAEVGGCVVLSTCNRMEIYFTDKYEQVEMLLANDRDVPVGLIRRYSMNYEGFQCMLHLCRVACGMAGLHARWYCFAQKQEISCGTLYINIPVGSGVKERSCATLYARSL